MEVRGLHSHSDGFSGRARPRRPLLGLVASSLTGPRPWGKTWLAACLVAVLGVGLVAAAGGATALASTPPQLNLKVLLIGEGSADVTTLAWEAALKSEGVPYDLAIASPTGTGPPYSVTLPALTSGTTGNYNGVVIANSPTDYGAGQLTALDSYESTFGVRQVDGYMFPSPALGVTWDSTSGALDGTTGTLTAAALAAFPELKGPVPFDVGTFGYAATVNTGAPYTPFITNAVGHVMAGVYQHPSTDPQAGVSELALNFDYNANQLQWLLLAPGLINWVTQNTHLGLYRNYFGQDIDDVMIADNEWSSQFQCTPGATNPPDVTCPPGVANNPADTPPDVQMSAADVAYVTNWEQQSGIKLNLLFNGVGACTAPSTAAESNANCTGSVTENGATYTDPGQNTTDTTAPNDAAFVNALLAAQGSFNWENHTWSHLFLGCTVADPQVLTSATAYGSGGTFSVGSYSYEITAATAYGESEPSVPQPVTVAANGSVTLTWPEATNGGGPSLAQEEASHTGGDGFWGYNVYRAAAGSTTYGLVGQVAENPSATSSTTYSFTDTGGSAGAGPSSTSTFPTATNPGIDCGTWLPATSTTADSSIEQEIGLNQAFAAANGLTNFTPAAVVTGEHSGIENPNMPASLAGTGVTTFAQDASRQPQQNSLGAALGAPRYPSNIYYNASNWPDELNEYNTLYAAPSVSLGNGETGHCQNTSSTTCITTPATEATVLASESHIMLSHVLNNDPRVGYAHQSNLIGPAATGYTILSLIDNMQSQYNTWYNTTAPLAQMTDVTSAQTLAEQNGWATAQTGGQVSASIQNGVVTVTNAGSATKIPVTVPTGTTVNGAAFGQSYAGTQSDWVSLGTNATETLNENVGPAIISAASATSIVGAGFSFTVATTGAPTPKITETGNLPTGITFTDNGNGTATIAGTAGAGTGGSYPITITAANGVGTSATQSFTLTNAEAPSITSPSTASFSTGVAGTYTVTTTGYPGSRHHRDGCAAQRAGVQGQRQRHRHHLRHPGQRNGGHLPGHPVGHQRLGQHRHARAHHHRDHGRRPDHHQHVHRQLHLSQAGAVAITTTGSPTPKITETGTLPAGLTFMDNGNGTALLQGTPTATGTTTLTITASNGITPDATQTYTVVVGQAPAFTSANTAMASVGTAFSFTVTVGGYPAPSWGESNLPPGVTFTDNKDGTATLAGTPTTAGTYTVPLVATNAYGSVQQTLTITVQQAPAITSGGSATFTVGTAGSFSVTTTGSPTAKITESGSLPSGVTLTDNGNGTATLAGTAAAGTNATYPITITAANGFGSNATQSFTLTVNAAPTAPAITSANSTTFTVGAQGSFSVMTTGSPDGGDHRIRRPALRRHLHRQRQRDGHPGRDSGGGDERQLPDHDHGGERGQSQRDPELHPHRQPRHRSPGHHQCQRDDLRRRDRGDVHGDDYRQPDGDPLGHEQPGPAVRGHLQGQRQRDGHPGRHAAGRQPGHLHADRHRQQFGGDGHPDLHADREQRPGHHERKLGDGDRGQGVQLHGHHRWLTDTDAEVCGDPARGCHVHRQRQRDGHPGRYSGGDGKGALPAHLHRQELDGYGESGLHADSQQRAELQQYGGSHGDGRYGLRLYGQYHGLPNALSQARERRQPARRSQLLRQRQWDREPIRHERGHGWFLHRACHGDQRGRHRHPNDHADGQGGCGRRAGADLH